MYSEGWVNRSFIHEASKVFLSNRGTKQGHLFQVNKGKSLKYERNRGEKAILEIRE